MGAIKKQTSAWHIRILFKCLFSFLFPVLLVLVRGRNPWLLCLVFGELCVILLLTELLGRFSPSAAGIVSSLAFFTINAQFAIHFWGSSFLTLTMLTNLDNLDTLSGHSALYILTAAAVFLFSFLPAKRVALPGKTAAALACGAVVMYAAVFFSGLLSFSPFVNTGKMIKEYSLIRSLGSDSAEPEGNPFAAELVADHRSKPETLPMRPNIILFFLEGFSENILEDPRGVMPNLQELESRSLSFSNYYNHTFATYMGLSGQLHSGYQYNNTDTNVLPSLHDILKGNGYRSAFLFPEPFNTEFIGYLSDMNFDRLITDETQADGFADSVGDRALFQMVTETAETLSRGASPFLLCVYNVGTHVSFDSLDVRFEDGTSPILNRFYGLDTYIGEFLESYEQSELTKNTLLVFTADHAAYQDADFDAAFPDADRYSTMCDRIPLIFYYDGIEPETLDADGRNSLDLTPTLLDYLDMSGANSFLGESLFDQDPHHGLHETTFQSMATFFSTSGAHPHPLNKEDQKQFLDDLNSYFALKLTVSSSAADPVQLFVSAEPQQDKLNLSVFNIGDWDTLHIAVWSEKDDQDDLIWFSVPTNGSEDISFELNCSFTDAPGNYFVHLYGSVGDEEWAYLQAGDLYVSEE